MILSLLLAAAAAQGAGGQELGQASASLEVSLRIVHACETSQLQSRDTRCSSQDYQGFLQQRAASRSIQRQDGGKVLEIVF